MQSVLASSTSWRNSQGQSVMSSLTPCSFLIASLKSSFASALSIPALSFRRRRLTTPGRPDSAKKSVACALKPLSALGDILPSQKPQRVTQDAVLHQNAYCRVHVHPKRFPAYYEHDWSSRLVLENEHCVVVSKPPGCQVPPRVDNQLECLTSWVSRFCGLETELKPVHRLDTGTEGLVVLAKNREFARYFQTLLLRQRGSLEKAYRALTQMPPPLGTLRHYVAANHHVKGQPRRTRVFSTQTDGASCAELEIRDVQWIRLNEAGRREWGVESAYEVDIELKTGRTHQIRVQLAHEGYPLLGDGLYRDIPPPPSSTTCLEPTDACLGLQAAALTLQDDALDAFFETQTDGYVRLEAGPPWWRE